MSPKVATRHQKRTPLLVQKLEPVQGIPACLWTRPPSLRQLGLKEYMGLFNVSCKVEHPAKPNKAEVVANLLVDTGTELTWIHEAVLKRVGIQARKTAQFQMANGQIITRSVGFAVLRVDQSFTVDEVVFGQKGDVQLLGARSLEGLNLVVDPKHKPLVPGEPRIAAVAR